MATLSNMGTPGVGTGILHPKMCNRFRLAFYDRRGNKLPYSDDLSKQAISTSTLSQHSAAEQVQLSIVIEDDVLNAGANAVQKLMKEKSFDLHIMYVDGNENILRTAVLKRCKVWASHFSGLDYACGPTRVKNYQLSRRSVGNAIESLKDNPIAYAVFLALQDLEYTVRDDSGFRAACTIHVDLLAKKLEFI